MATWCSEMRPYTVIYDTPDDFFWQGFNCMADDADHAEEQCLNAYPEAGIVWVNEGHNNFNMETP